MSNPTDRFVTNRMSDSTDLSDVDDGVNGLESAIRTTFQLPADTAVTPMSVDADSQITVNSGLRIGTGQFAASIVQSIPESGQVNELATVDAIRSYVLAHAGGGGGGGFEFSAGQEYGSLWVSSTLGLGVGFPAYWQIVSRAPSGGESTLSVDTATTPTSFTSIPWTHTLREHPWLTAHTASRPVQTQLAPSMFSFPCVGLWHIELVMAVPNFNGVDWYPLQWMVDAGPPNLYLQPAWTAMLVKLGSPDAVLDICVSPHQGSVHQTSLSIPNCVLQAVQSPPVNGGYAKAPVAMFDHSLHLNRTFYVEDVEDLYEIQVQQMSGGTVTLENDHLRMVLRHIPTNGG